MGGPRACPRHRDTRLPSQGGDARRKTPQRAIRRRVSRGRRRRDHTIITEHLASGTDASRTLTNARLLVRLTSAVTCLGNPPYLLLPLSCASVSLIMLYKCFIGDPCRLMLTRPPLPKPHLRYKASSTHPSLGSHCFPLGARPLGRLSKSASAAPAPDGAAPALDAALALL